MEDYLKNKFEFDIYTYEHIIPDYSWITTKDNEKINNASLIAIVGSSGSGKSLLGSKLCENILDFTLNEDEKNKKLLDLISEDVADILLTVGLKSIPTWNQPLNTLSCGEQYRALLALKIKENIFIDEFTSQLDRLCAASCSKGLSKLVHKKQLTKVVIATCHRDILHFLKPNIVIDCDRKCIFYDKVYDSIKIEINTINEINELNKDPSKGQIIDSVIQLQHMKSDWKSWNKYKKHHYLTGEIMKSSKCHEFFWNGISVGFVATAPLVSRIKNSVRESRLVVLPFAQGLGIGVAISEYIAIKAKNDGKRYFTKTSHPALGKYRNKNSNKWRPTIYNGKKSRPRHNQRQSYERFVRTEKISPCFCHEFIG